MRRRLAIMATAIAVATGAQAPSGPAQNPIYDAKRQTVDMAKIKNGMRNLLAYCKANPDQKVIQANEALIGADR